jgi:hypothetical protein
MEKPSVRAERQRGSVLLLVPAGILVLMILGAIAVDSAVVFLGQRELGSAVAAAANDAAAAAFAEAPFYEGGRVEIDVSLAQHVAQQSFDARKAAQIELTGPLEVTVVGRQICVAAEATVRRIFTPRGIGVSPTATIRARSGATLSDDRGVEATSACEATLAG